MALIEECREQVARAIGRAGISVRDPEHADAEQEALLAIWTAFPTLTHDEKRCGWMSTIARNKSVDRIRKNVRERRFTKQMEALAEAAVDAPGPPAISEAELAELVMTSVSEKYRLVLESYYLERKKPEQIAAEQFVSVATVYTQLKRGRQLALAVLREAGHG